MKDAGRKKVLSASTAFRFVLVIRLANFFADMTYEGARSVTGPFLGTPGFDVVGDPAAAGPPYARNNWLLVCVGFA